MKHAHLAAVAILALGLPVPAHAAEVTAFVSNALKSTFEEFAPAFDKTTGHKLKATYGTTEPLKVRIEKGEIVDFALLGEGAIDELVKQGKLVAGTRAVVARSGLGIAIRKGAPKPDLSSSESFKRALLAATSISYNERGLTGDYLKVLFARLGITDAIKAKHKNGSGAELVGKGESEIGITQASEILLAPGVELGGVLPAEIQNYTVFPAAVATGAKEPEAAKTLLKYLAAPDAMRVMRSQGLEPAG